MQIRIGSRKSKLALIQTNIVVKLIEKTFPEIKCVVVPVATTGDKITDKNLYEIGGKALFLKELEEKILDGQIDMAVHSLKDVPGRLADNLMIAAVTEREDPRDCFVSFKYKSIDELPLGAVVGTSSVRRKVILQQKRPDLKIVPFRGNIHTRLQKLQNQEVDATILACAGLIRADMLNPQYCYPLEVGQMLPAAGQGTIAIEVHKDNKMAQEICRKINHISSWHLASAERGLLSYLDASCDTPLSAHAIFNGDVIEANYMMSDIDGSNIHYHREIGSIESASEMGVQAAIKLLNQ